MHPTTVTRHPSAWAACTLSTLVLFGLASSLNAEVRDVREVVARQSAHFRAKHFPSGCLPPKHDWRKGRPARPGVTAPQEVPGGIGYGFMFNNDALLWNTSTIADYYVIAPTFLGGNVYTLYLTSTCRAKLGTEALVEYWNENEANFWIYDWAQPDASRWQVMIDLPTDHPEYLTRRPDEFGVTRQMVHLRNGTEYLGTAAGQYNWRNQVLLFNFARGDWDLLYAHSYSTTNLSDNIFVAGQNNYSWGPIVETFETYTNVHPVGFDLVRLFQDGNPNPRWLSPANSYISQSAPWQLLTLAPNTGFTVAVSPTNLVKGAYNVGSLCVMASTNAASFSISPRAGSTSSNWVIAPCGKSWEKTVAGLSPGAYTITFNPVPGLTTPCPQTFTINSNLVTLVQAVYGTNLADSPIAVTGFNRDVVVERTATGGDTAAYCQPFNPAGGTTFYEAGLGDIGSWSFGDGSDGLPQGGALTSALDGVTAFQLAPYTTNNVLYLTASAPTRTLYLDVPAAYNSLSLLAGSANGSGSGSFTINFADKTSSRPIEFDARDWWAYNPDPALTGFGLLSTGNYGVFYTQDATNLPNLYQTSVRLDALGLNTKPIVSLTFSRASGPDTSTDTATGVFAVSGRIAPPAFQCAQQLGAAFVLTWSCLSNGSYQVQYRTNLAQADWLNLGPAVTATNCLMRVSDKMGTAPRRFYRLLRLR